MRTEPRIPSSFQNEGADGDRLLPAIPYGNGYQSVPPASIRDLFQGNLLRRGEAVALWAAVLIDGRELLP